MEKKYLVVNLKTYSESSGKNAVKIAKAIESELLRTKRKDIEAIVCPQATDLSLVSKAVKKVKVFAQHADLISPGKNTGFLSPSAIFLSGARGTLLNHAEHQVPKEVLGKTVSLCRETGLVTIACATDEADSAIVAKISPDFVSVEPPELIGSGISVSSSKPEVIYGSVRAVRANSPGAKVLCGAGISSGEDVRKAIELGAEGVLLASYITLAKDVKAAVREIISGF